MGLPLAAKVTCGRVLMEGGDTGAGTGTGTGAEATNGGPVGAGVARRGGAAACVVSVSCFQTAVKRLRSGPVTA